MNSNDSFNAAMPPPRPVALQDPMAPRPVTPDVRNCSMDRFSAAHSHPQVPLEDFEEHLHHLVTARAALDAALLTRVRGPHLPQSAAIDELIAHMPFQDKVALVDRDLGIATMRKQLGVNQRAALHNCSAAMAAADQTVERFLRAPSSTEPVELHVVAFVLEQALSALEAAYA